MKVEASESRSLVPALSCLKPIACERQSRRISPHARSNVGRRQVRRTRRLSRMMEKKNKYVAAVSQLQVSMPYYCKFVVTTSESSPLAHRRMPLRELSWLEVSLGRRVSLAGIPPTSYRNDIVETASRVSTVAIERLEICCVDVR